jgi:plastocyanin
MVPVQAVAPTTPPVAAAPAPTAVPAVPATPTAEAPARPPPVTVAMTLSLADRSFTPHQIHGNAGDTVALTFIGATEAHTFTVSSLGIDVAIAARETKQFSFVMPVEGEVPFFCRLHGSPTAGMHGLLIFH